MTARLPVALILLAVSTLGLSGCAAVSLAASAAGAAISVTGAVVSTGVEVTGKAVGAGIDALSARPAAPTAGAAEATAQDAAARKATGSGGPRGR